ncbi:MAG TPA: tripartite tricarboxylate transporter substrate-binding protein, partial [Burkholderiales bacterium]|nr:tripartite tricarboxylate transporter substrate-binding protein [Burkholderiales bacterium]
MRFCLLIAALWAASAGAQNYPNRPVRFVVPLAPAGAGDIVARTIAAKLAEAWGQQVVIDNRPGANTIIGTDLVAKSKPDGYTWLLGVQGSLAINPATYRSLPYDAEKDFDPVTQMTL